MIAALRHSWSRLRAAPLTLDELFKADPLHLLDEALARGESTVAVGARSVCLGEATAARAVLGNAQGLYEEHSDFFSTRRGMFGTREVRRVIRNESRALLQNFLNAQSPSSIEDFLRAHLPAESIWPDTGNRLLFTYLRPVLMAPSRPARLRRLLVDIVEQAVLKSSRRTQSIWRRRLLQLRASWALSRELERLRANPAPVARDILDVIARASRPEHALEDLIEVYLAFVFSIAGSMGFLLGWAIYLQGTHPAVKAPAHWVVQEALRLWPVAWLLIRRPVIGHPLCSRDVDPSHEVIACPYLVQRNAAHWPRATHFDPLRWAEPAAWVNPAFIAFGHGAHRCIASDLSTRLVAAFLTTLQAHHELVVTTVGTGPHVGPAMAAPQYRLQVLVKAQELLAGSVECA